MSTYRLEHVISPRSVALVGASARAGPVGHAVLRNLRDGGFGGAVFPVNPRHAEIDGMAVRRDSGERGVRIVSRPLRSAAADAAMS